MENISESKNQKGKLEKKLNYEIRCKNGALYKRHCGFALTPQNYPDAVNKNSFSHYILRPGKVYNHNMTYKFGVLQKC